MEGEKPEQFFLPKIEKKILEFWDKNKIFEESLRRREGGKPFVFYEGPPYANGKPGIHHVEARSFKDILVRYKTMQKFYVERKAGWDTHGLPTEIAAEKALGIKSKKEIEEKVGIEAFVKAARDNVFLFKEEWEKMTRRMGYWLDMENPYLTMTNDYIESLWWIIQEIAKRGYLYEADKILPWCTRCGTALSSHELAQGYKKTKDKSIYIKFKLADKSDTYFLAWTTTPWTLLGNVALAVNPNIEYAVIEHGGEKYILARTLAEKLFPEDKISDYVIGKNMEGTSYEPLYEVAMDIKEKNSAFKIISADFVSIEDGTGIVHIAPAFGEDDMHAGRKNNLPILRVVDEEGKYTSDVDKWNNVSIWDANTQIIENLKERRFLWRTEEYEHDYPFCWRCDSKIIYFAKKSWWIKMSDLREELLIENNKINWFPSYLKDGRFGEWLKEVKDWSFSRERYWGTPLPVWRCDLSAGGCAEWKTIGSVDELIKRGVNSHNRYIVMRHGEAESNEANIINSSLETNHYSLTEKGKAQVQESINTLKKNNIVPVVIVASPFLRTKETANLLAEAFYIKENNIIIDARIGEINTGVFDGKKPEEYRAFFTNLNEKFTKAPPDGETIRDLASRVLDAMLELERHYQNKTIFIATHEYSCWAIWTIAAARTDEEAVSEKIKRGDEFLPTGGFEEINFMPMPRDEKGNLDLHKPYIDFIRLSCAKCGGQMTRVPEVVDVWFDSGAMPLASRHFPFETKNPPYPADYICEAIDQTRGWFYTLLAVGVLLGLGTPYKNVISLGLVLDEKGKKMSKSKGNVVDPWKLFDTYGADSVRWYFFTINQPWDSKLFAEADVKDVSRRFFMILWNSFVFWETYGNNAQSGNFDIRNSTLIINKWILERLSELVGSTQKKLDSYDIVGAARGIETFVAEDLSRWYIRRVRGIMRHESAESKETSEIYDFFERGHSNLPLSKNVLNKLFARLDLASVTREVGYLEFVKAKTKDGIEIRYYEDGLYILEISSDKIEDAQLKLKKYFEEALGPAVAYIFSLGAPTPKVLANIKNEHPTVITAAPEHIQKSITDNSLYGEIYSKMASKNIEVYKTPDYIFISASPELASAIAHITETQIFFREFKDQLEKYLNIHRIIWEEISHIKERKTIRATEIDGLRSTLDSYQKTINLISSRINQMGTYAQTRSSIAKNLNIEEYLIELFQYKFEVLSDTLAYIKEIWKMTSEYLTTAINILVEIKNQGVKSSVQSLQIITSIGVVSGIIGYFSRSEFPRFTQTGVLYFVVIIAFTMLVNSIVNYIYKHKKYRLKFVEEKKNL